MMKSIEDQEEKSFIMTQSELILNEKESIVVSLTDITAYKRLRMQEHNNLLLKHLNATVHHEMLAPLKANIEISGRIIRRLKKDPETCKMARIIFISSQMVMLHANDMLDQRIIDSGSFVPNYTYGSPTKTIYEMIDIIQQTITSDNLFISIDKSRLDRLPPKLKFDQRRYQQVLLNLLSNAIKYTKFGEIRVQATIVCYSSSDNLQLETVVSDEGIGLTNEELKKIFTPFALLGNERTLS